VKWDGAGVVWRGADGSIQHYPASRVPFYTASLDAAVTLVPDGCGWMVMKNVAKVGRWPKRGATPALALCAAALRARAAACE
jgi:hypothetical protein